MPEKRLQTFRACPPVRNKGSKVAELTCGVGRSRSLSCLPAVNSADFPSSLFPWRLEVDAATDERVFVIWDGGGAKHVKEQQGCVQRQSTSGASANKQFGSQVNAGGGRQKDVWWREGTRDASKHKDSALGF